jgi:hypothetical protein
VVPVFSEAELKKQKEKEEKEEIKAQVIKDPTEALRQAQIEADKVQALLDDLTKQYENAQNKIVEVTFLKCGWGYIQRRELKTHLKIYVKVFHGARETHEISVGIMDKI